MKIKTFDKIVYGLSIVGVISLGIWAYTSATQETLLMQASEKIIQNLYTYNDMNTLLANAENLKNMCEPEVFTILDNTSKPNLTRRFSVYTPTSATIKNLIVDNDEVHAVVTFNRESNLPDKYIILEYSDDNLLENYTEYDFSRKFEEDFDYLGEFEETLNPETDGH